MHEEGKEHFNGLKMSDYGIQEIDALEAVVIIDNDLDPLSTIAPDTVQVSGQLGNLASASPHRLTDRGDACRELRMEDICCSAHGLSVLVTATRGDTKRSVLFDAGPEEEAWEKNVRRLRLDLSCVDLILLSHWHRDHSGGLPRAIRMINDAKQARGLSDKVVVDLHPNRPDYRGLALGDKIISLQADPKFEELEEAGALVDRNQDTHAVLDDLFLVSGHIPRTTKYEQGLKNAMRFDLEEKDWVSDESIADERFLACKLKDQGIVLFTGCSHAGLINTTKEACEAFSDRVPVHAVLGGFHLATSDNDQLESTVQDLKRLDPAVLLPGHCTGWRAKFAIEKHLPGSLVPLSVGMKITF